MSDPFQIQRELRYGAPVCDEILTGRYFTIGYSWYFRQPKWVLEIAVRELNAKKDILETYVLKAPIFYFDRKIETIGDDDDKYGIDVPIPHAFTKSVLAEDTRGRLKLWTFEMENKKLSGDLEDYLAVTYDVEQKVGGRFWDRIAGADIHDQKRKRSRMWSAD